MLLLRSLSFLFFHPECSRPPHCPFLLFSRHFGEVWRVITNAKFGCYIFQSSSRQYNFSYTAPGMSLTMRRGGATICYASERQPSRRKNLLPYGAERHAIFGHVSMCIIIYRHACNYFAPSAEMNFWPPTRHAAPHGKHFLSSSLHSSEQKWTIYPKELTNT